MFAPLITWPLVVSKEAPTRKFEYGECEKFLARFGVQLWLIWRTLLPWTHPRNKL